VERVNRLESIAWDALVVLFYSPVALGCLLWLYRFGGEWAVVRRTVGEHLLRDAALGLLAGLGLVLLTRALARLPVGQRMVGAFREELGHLGPRSWVVVALASAVGEELLFRAVLQPSLGWAAATLLFAAAHVPWQRELWPWPVFALVSGAVLGGLYELTGAVAASVVAHAVVNGLNLMWIATASTGSATSSPAPRGASPPTATPRTGSRTDG
jgi:membrane protease YdiL (CAAX protease family)